MKLVSSSPSPSPSSSSSSTSSCSYSSEERHCIQSRMEQFERLHPHLPPPPPPPHFKGKKHPHHGRHFPLPRHHRHHSVPQHRHHFPPPSDSLHSERGQLRVKPLKLPSKKVHKRHHKLMKACKVPKGGGVYHHSTHVIPAPVQAAFSGGYARFEHPPGCCLHYHGMDIGEGAEGWRAAHEVGTDHHAHLHRLHVHPHPHRHQPCLKREIGRGVVAPRHEAAYMLNEPPMEAGGLPPSPGMLPADNAAPAKPAPYLQPFGDASNSICRLRKLSFFFFLK